MNQDRSDIWTPRSVVNSERSHKSKIPRGFEKDLGSKIDVNTMTSFITQPESVFLNKTNYSNGNILLLDGSQKVLDPCERIIKTLKKNRDKFVDNIFLASISSLVNSLKNNKKPEWKSLEWLRIPELYRQAKLTLYEEITPLSIKPGTLKNYDFLSVLAALSEYPDLVRKLVEVKN